MIKDADDSAVNPEAVSNGNYDNNYGYLCDIEFDEIDVGNPDVDWSIGFDASNITWLQDHSKAYY